MANAHEGARQWRSNAITIASTPPQRSPLPRTGDRSTWGRHAGVVVRYRVVVSGRVQGVWYRESCRRVAQELGVGGWVRNNADGTVEAVIEGGSAPVDALLDWMRAGPPHAVVVGFEHHEEPPVGEPGFAVR